MKSLVKFAFSAVVLGLFVFAQFNAVHDEVLVDGWAVVSGLALTVYLVFVTGDIKNPSIGWCILYCIVGAILVNTLLTAIPEPIIRGVMVWITACTAALIGIARWLVPRIDAWYRKDQLER